jgi:uncharacterized protein
MPKIHYACKLLPPRPNFAFDMSDEERSIMQRHIDYWKPYLQQDKMLIYGPVLDPSGPYGLGIIAVDTEDEMKELTANDPGAQICKYEIHQMNAVSKFSLGT